VRSFLALLLIAAVLPARAETPQRAALFPVEFVDTSPEAPTQAELARVKVLGVQLRDLLTKSGHYTFVDIAPVAAEASSRDLWNCNGCETAFAKKVGAQVSVVAWVQKVSDLILNINAVIRDTSTGKPLAAGSVDIRGNTDETWSRGLRYLAKNRLLP
jgi:hypothetical protein